MKSLFLVVIFLQSQIVNAQTQVIKVRDFRPYRDSLEISKELRQDIELTSRYICRNFKFCSEVPTKKELTTALPNEQNVHLPRPDKSQLVVQRDLTGRIVLKVYYSCLKCLSESYGYKFSYDTSGNKIAITQLTPQDIFYSRQGLEPNLTDPQKRTKTWIDYGPTGFIQSLQSFTDDKLLFSIKVVQ